jgi:hypothetical protein
MTTFDTTGWKAEFVSRAVALTPETVDHFMGLYAQDCDFSDPFHSLKGRKAIAQAYRSMFLNLHAPCFTNLVIAEVASLHPQSKAVPDDEPLELAARWVFRFAVGPGKPMQAIAGTSWLRVDCRAGLITRHEDHWDAASLFESFGALSWAVRFLRQRVARAALVTNMT